jgi:hypothetical protein
MNEKKQKISLTKALLDDRRRFPAIDKTTWFYKNCKRQRKTNAKICQVCPFRTGIEEQESKDIDEGKAKYGLD